MVTVSRAAWKMTTTTTTTTTTTATTTTTTATASGVRACLFPGRGLLFRDTLPRARILLDVSLAPGPPGLLSAAAAAAARPADTTGTREQIAPATTTI